MTRWVRQAMIFSADETAGVGVDDATPVTNDYAERENHFTGKIIDVTVDVMPLGTAGKAPVGEVEQMKLNKALSD